MCAARTFFRQVVSGLHGSTTAHLTAQHYPEEDGSYLPNFDMAVSRLVAYPDRILNLYAAFSLVDQALAKLGQILAQSEADALKPLRSLGLYGLAHQIVVSPQNASGILSGVGSDDIEALRLAFQNISRLVNCVGCTLCRLHSKMQLLGLGTAFQVVLTPPDELELLAYSLTPSEWGALVQTALKLTESIYFVNFIEEALFSQQLSQASGLVSAGTLVVLLLPLIVQLIRPSPRPGPDKAHP